MYAVSYTSKSLVIVFSFGGEATFSYVVLHSFLIILIIRWLGSIIFFLITKILLQCVIAKNGIAWESANLGSCFPWCQLNTCFTLSFSLFICKIIWLDLFYSMETLLILCKSVKELLKGKIRVHLWVSWGGR